MPAITGSLAEISVMPLVASAGLVIERAIAGADTGSSVTMMLARSSARSKPGYCCATEKPSGGASLTFVPGTRTGCAAEETAKPAATAASARRRMILVSICSRVCNPPAVANLR